MNEDKKEKKKGGLPDPTPPIPAPPPEKKKKEKDFFSNEIGIDLTAAVIFRIDKTVSGLNVLAELNYMKLDKLMGGFSEITTGDKKYRLKKRKASARGIVLEYQEVK